jgi:hypothetical protein
LIGVHRSTPRSRVPLAVRVNALAASLGLLVMNAALIVTAAPRACCSQRLWRDDGSGWGSGTGDRYLVRHLAFEERTGFLAISTATLATGTILDIRPALRFASSAVAILSGSRYGIASRRARSVHHGLGGFLLPAFSGLDFSRPNCKTVKRKGAPRQ